MHEEIEHTADYAIRVRGLYLAHLFIEAARGMNALTGGRPENFSVGREITLQALDLETLLVTWLEELAFLMETEGEIYDRFKVLAFSPTELRVKVQGGPAAKLDKLIKAITFHDLSINKTAAGYETTIVFDV